MDERLQKVMAHAGIASRRQCEEMIKQGRVTVNGNIATLGLKVDPRKDNIVIDGSQLPTREELVYIMLHKPRNVLSDADDTGEGRRTARDMVDVPGHLYPVGRLDKQSVGLILLTNDGDLAHKLTHPRFGHEKVYRVKVEGNPSNATLDQWRKGVELEDGKTAPAKITAEKRSDEATWLRIILKEGRKRQIRRVAAKLGHPVQHLEREQLGPLRLGSLPLGKWRHLNPDEVARLKRYVEGAERGGRAATGKRPQGVGFGNPHRKQPPNKRRIQPPSNTAAKRKKA